LDEVFPVVQAAAMLTASQFRQAECRWFSGKARVSSWPRLRFCGAREAYVDLHNERTLVGGIDAALGRDESTFVVDVLLRKRTIGAGGCAGEQG
jgi:hypothetical protein